MGDSNSNGSSLNGVNRRFLTFENSLEENLGVCSRSWGSLRGGGVICIDLGAANKLEERGGKSRYDMSCWNARKDFLDLLLGFKLSVKKGGLDLCLRSCGVLN